MQLSVIIITLNESENLPRCLKSIPKDLEVIIVDSGSADNTVEIAESFGAKVFHKDFIHYSDQKNFALSKATGDWVLSVDADEVLSGGLVKNIQNSIAHDKDLAFRIRRRLVFMGRKLRFGKTFDFPIRVFPNNKTSFVGEIHEKIDTSNLKVRTLENSEMLHYSYKNLTDYFQRFNRYTSMIADKKKGAQTLRFKVNLYFRFWSEFILRYFIKGGFLDGHPGYCYALISSMYTYVKFAKQLENDL